jgi:TATA-box binding protein (TBP) (component of TFIID and TFIIIB)
VHLATLEAVFKSGGEILVCTGGSSLEVKENVLRVTLCKIEESRRAVETTSIRVNIVCSLAVRPIQPKHQANEQCQNEYLHLHKISINSLLDLFSLINSSKPLTSLFTLTK